MNFFTRRPFPSQSVGTKRKKGMVFNHSHLNEPTGVRTRDTQIKSCQIPAFPWLNENRNAVFMRFSGYFSLRYFFDSFLSWLIENRNAVFMRFSGYFSSPVFLRFFSSLVKRKQKCRIYAVFRLFFPPVFDNICMECYQQRQAVSLSSSQKGGDRHGYFYRFVYIYTCIMCSCDTRCHLL